MALRPARQGIDPGNWQSWKTVNKWGQKMVDNKPVLQNSAVSQHFDVTKKKKKKSFLVFACVSLHVMLLRGHMYT